MAEFAHKFANTNGIKMHYVEAGVGPTVLLCHGFPESWYSWRHQINALAEAGFHAVAPDLRGYGQTDRPAPVEAYDIFQLTGDLVGLVNSVLEKSGEKSAVIVGHDWGALITPYAALFRPDLFRAVGLLSVPYRPRGPISPSEWEQKTYPGKIFYQAIFRSTGAEKIFEADVRAGIINGLYSASGSASPNDRWNPVIDPNALRQPPSSAPAKLPAWITEKDIDFLADEFQRTGFTGGLNYYRNMDRNWALTPFLDGAKLRQPTLFIAGDKDAVIEFLGDELNAMDQNVPDLKKKVILPGVGHWTQQESPAEVNRLLIEFLKTL
jgi:pimeloyl-ACP methyl ester carboxylesterase